MNNAKCAHIYFMRFFLVFSSYKLSSFRIAINIVRTENNEFVSNGHECRAVAPDECQRIQRRAHSPHLRSINYLKNNK